MDENAEAWDVYQRCQGQLIMSEGGPVDINLLAVEYVMRLLKVEDELECLDKVHALACKVISEQHKDNARKRDDKAG